MAGQDLVDQESQFIQKLQDLPAQGAFFLHACQFCWQHVGSPSLCFTDFGAPGWLCTLCQMGNNSPGEQSLGYHATLGGI